MGDKSYPECQAQELYDEFVSASTCRSTLRSFSQLCQHLQLDQNTAERPLYRPIKQRLNYWKANALWAKLDRRAAQPEYLRAQVCKDTTCVVIGAGPCGLRMAVELSFMGARVVLLEKRDSFSRNNVLHLWPFTIHDLRTLGAKKFYGKFCAGAINHISIRQLQLVLLKVALLLGVEVHVNVEFRKLVEPPEDQHPHKVGWRMEVSPKFHLLNQLEFDVVIGADGRRNTLPGFRRKEFRGKLAIAITANFKNRNTSAEAKVEEISGVAFIFNQRFFRDLHQETGIDLENIVYYKDDTHYFVMTAKKQSLLDKGVIRQDLVDSEQLLSRGNVDQNALQAYAREAANFSTNHQLPSLDFAINHYGQPDVAMFDFTSMYASENAAMVRQRHGHQLLITLVGDSLLEPFWPMGTGVARGFLAALDSAWMIRNWSQGAAPLDVLAERESLYRLLPTTTPENMQRNITLFSIDPATRYLNPPPPSITPAQVRHLVDTGEEVGLNSNCDDIIRLPSPSFLREESFSRSNQLLSWCQEQTRGYCGVAIDDLTTSWRSGLALCALIHRHRPDLMLTKVVCVLRDFDSLDPLREQDNVLMAIGVAEREFGIPPVMTAEEMRSGGGPDSLSMVMYLSQFHQLLKDSPPTVSLCHSSELRSALVSPASLLSRLGRCSSIRLKPQELEDTAGKKRKTSGPEEEKTCDLNCDINRQVCDQMLVGGSRVRLMANQLQAKLNESLSTYASSTSSAAAALHHQGEALSSPVPLEAVEAAQQSSWRPRKRTLQQEQMSFRFKEKLKSQSSTDQQVCGGCSDTCFLCKRKVYVMERVSAEGLFFHRSCFQCYSCGSTLRLAAYTYDRHDGRFYCLQHHGRLNAETMRTRWTLPNRAAAARGSTACLVSVPSPSSTDSLVSADCHRWSAVSVRAGTPETVELEKYRRRSTALEEELQGPGGPQEVSEETLNWINLGLEQKLGSSQSEMEEEEEEEYKNEEEEEDEETSDGSDITLSDTPEDPDSASKPPSSITSSTPLSVTPPRCTTPSTTSFNTTPDFTHDDKRNTALPTNCTPVVITRAITRKQPAAGEWGSFDDITPELPSNKLLQEKEVDSDKTEEEAESEWLKRRKRHTGAHSLPPCLLLPSLQAGGGALLLQLKGLREAPRQVDVEIGGARALWRAVFSGKKKERKKRGGTLPPHRETANQRRATGLSPTGDSGLDSSMLLWSTQQQAPWKNNSWQMFDLTAEFHKVSMKEEEDQEPIYIPHALAFQRSYGIQKTLVKDRHPLQESDGQSSSPTEVVGVFVQPKEQSSLSVKETMFQRVPDGEDQDLDVKITRRVQRAAQRKAKREELKRFHRAQMIQMLLQQLEEKQKRLEQKGVMVERALRGEAVSAGLSGLDNTALMQQWFQLVQQRNILVRYESELTILARELELEDRQSRLQQELRERMAVDDNLKEDWQLVEERLILEEMLDVVEQRNSLVSLLDEQRLQDQQEDQNLGEEPV
ncbi:protein-methionine sulfoxide oxidase mical3a-like isoform X3 [Echeneis naucrates]|uniref:protein-methionine sulfoxide oxidase mical3a-like isoform X3 n=1 Tax=Echeneis naucrates TaxID=173247 RepID=UPI001113D68F|nr:protein-methionine sulfoxide oxidase mical3a-like isoform X3 [Echeneis naucrates]